MKANNHVRQNRSNDEGVSPVIAVILMVAITVVLAATVYVWVGGFASDDTGPESAQVRAAGYDEDGDGATDWIRLTLVRGENAPYASSVVSFTALDHDAASYTALCNDLDGTTAACTGDAFDGSETWSVGSVKYVPCGGDGRHQLTLTIRGSTVLDTSINCDEAGA